MKEARGSAGALAVCILAMLGGEDADPVDVQAGAFIVAETIQMWRRSVAKG